MKSAAKWFQERGALLLYRVGLLALCGLASCSSCNEQVQQLSFGLEAQPRSLDFGNAPIRFSTRSELTLIAQGTGRLEIRGAEIGGKDAALFEVPFGPDSIFLYPGASSLLSVFFAPQLEGSYSATLVLQSNSDAGDLVVPLKGVGKAPDIRLCHPLASGQTEPDCAPNGSPLTLDLGAAARAEQISRSLLIRNLGEAPLKIFADGTGLADSAAGFALGTPLGGASIVAGGGVEIPISFLGNEQGPTTTTLTIQSNDPDESAATVILQATGAVNQAPTACAATLEIEGQDHSIRTPVDPSAPVARPADTLRFTAHPNAGCSLDPEDGQAGLSYQWTLLELPAISGASLANASAGPAPGTGEPPPWLVIDALGLYRVQLILRDAQGLQSAAAEIVIDAIPKDDLTVELSWHEAADLDLHLLAPGASPFCTPLDCFWDTCDANTGSGIPVLDWGQDSNADGKLDPDSDTQTDPILVFDNVGATVVGTDTRLETIRLPTAATSGSVPYKVGVHFFENKGATEVNAAVKVVYKGAILWENSVVLTPAQVGSYWSAGEVDIGAGTGVVGSAAPVSIPAYAPPPASCP